MLAQAASVVLDELQNTPGRMMASTARLPALLLAMWAMCAAGCGASRSTSHAGRSGAAAVAGRLREMFSDLERSRYTEACEAFTIRSRYGLAIASALNGRESDGPCADVFATAGALEHLGFAAVGRALRGNAVKAGLAKAVELPSAEVHRLYDGLGSTAVSPVVGLLQITGNEARYEGSVVARYEGAGWLLEAVRAKTTFAEEKQLIQRRCRRPSASSGRYQRLCQLMEAVMRGKVLSGGQNREFDRLLPVLFASPSRAAFSR